jgi:hypothetical protein
MKTPAYFTVHRVKNGWILRSDDSGFMSESGIRNAYVFNKMSDLALEIITLSTDPTEPKKKGKKK